MKPVEYGIASYIKTVTGIPQEYFECERFLRQNKIKKHQHTVTVFVLLHGTNVGLLKNN
jgi:hypothetical protein